MRGKDVNVVEQRESFLSWRKPVKKIVTTMITVINPLAKQGNLDYRKRLRPSFDLVGCQWSGMPRGD